MRRLPVWGLLVASVFLAAGALAEVAEQTTATLPDGTPDPQTRRRTPIVEVFQQCKDAVVYLRGPKVEGNAPTVEEFFEVPGRKQETSSVGSAFVVHESGYIVANAHAVEKVVSHEITLSDGKKYPAELIASVWDHDLALLKIDAGRPLSAVRLADTAELLIGETVIVIANPHGLLHTCTAGILSAVGRATTPADMPGVTLRHLIQTDASINPGSSGGPWFNVLGEVIGVTTSMKRGAENIGFAVSAGTVRKLLPGMLDVHRRYGLVSGLEVSADGPARVKAMVDGSPAAKVGLQVGDVLVAIDSRPVPSSADVHMALIGRKPGEKLALKLLREGKPVEVSLTLAARVKPDGAALLQEKYGLVAVPLDEAAIKAMSLRVKRGVLVKAVRTDLYDGLDNPPMPGDVLGRIGKIRPRDLDHVGLLLEDVNKGQPLSLVLLRKKGEVISRVDLNVASPQQ